MKDIQQSNGGGAVVHVTPDIGSILSAAVDKGVPPEQLGKLLDLYERMQKLQAERDFAAALSRFKQICPPVQRRTENQQFTVVRDGRKVARRYASLEDIERTIRIPLGECGLSYRWGDSRVDQGSMTIQCIVSHIGGHSVSSSVVLPVDSRAGCSEQQKYGSAMTYAQRYSLIQALGLTSCDEDTDGNEPPGDVITTQQYMELDTILVADEADVSKFCGFFGIKSVSELPAARFDEAKAMLRKRREAKAKAAKGGAA